MKTTRHNFGNFRAAKSSGITTTHVVKPTTRNYSAISKHVTPNDFKTAFRMAQIGNPAQLFEILRFFYKMDDEIPGAMQSLKSAITDNDFVITPNPDEGEAAIKQAAVFTHLFEQMDMIALADELLDAHYYGFSSASIPPEAWQAESIEGKTYQVPSTFEVLPRSWMYAKKENKSDDYNTLYVGAEPYYTYPKGAILLFSQKKLPSYENIDFTNFGVGIACILFAVRKYFNEEDAAAFNEVFGTPMVVGHVGQGGEQAIVKQAVIEAGNSSRAVVGENDKIEFIQSNQSGSVDVFDRSAERWNKAIAKIIKSESLTDNMGSHGSNAAMYTTNGIRKDVASKLKRQIMTVIMRHFVQPVVELNWGGKLMVDIDLIVEGVDDDMKKINIYEKASRLVDLSKQQVYDEFSLNAPVDDEDRIEKKSIAGGFF